MVLGVILLFTFMGSVSASSSSLAAGLPLTGAINKNPNGATDGDETTYTTIQFRGTAILTFPVAVDINALYANGSDKFKINFYDTSGKAIKYLTMGYSSDPEQKITSGTLKEVTVKNVTKITIYNDDGNYNILKEFQVYGDWILERPVGLNFVPGIRSVQIDFTAVNGVEGYYLYVNGVKHARLDTNSYTLENLVPDIPVNLQLTAIHKGGIESPLTDPIRKVPLGDVVKPELKAVGNWNVVDLSWKAIEGARNWTVLRDGREIYSRAEAYQGYSDKSVKPETEYIYQLRYTDKYGRVVDSDSVKVKVPVKPDDVEPPEKPLGLTARMSADYLSIQLSWKPSPEPDLAGYNLYVSDNGGEKKKLNKALMKQTSYALTGIMPEHKYEFLLEAVDETGNVSEPAAASITVPRKTTDSNQEENPDYILVTWTKTEGAVGYLIYLNGRQVGEVGPNVFEFKITRAMGYNPDALSNVTLVRAKFADGSIGDGNNGSKPGLPGGGWGIGGSDIWKNIVLLVGSLAGFLILGIVIKLVPRVVRLIYHSIKRQQSY
ncbi:Exoglucanase B precursor [compost metagenome]